MNAPAAVISAAYRLLRPALFRHSPQAAHEKLLNQLAARDNSSFAINTLRALHRVSTRHAPLHVGGAALNFPLMMAAGFVKGRGFATEAQALLALERDDNLIPGWQAVPALVGQVEFGSFTRYPRTGNSGVVLWRDVHTQSLQNRVGLRNPGARAAAYFLRERRNALPPIYGINLAVSPGVTNAYQQQTELSEAAHLFLEAQLHPAWLTLNLSCPNTEDDPAGRQTKSLTRLLCEALIKVIQHYRRPVPLWVKVSPGLSAAQYRALMSAAAEAGAQGIVATNTLGAPAPDQSGSAGLSGKQLFPHSLDAAAELQKLRYELNAPLDVIACGGILDGAALAAFHAIGVYAAQVWSAFVFRGPLALQMIESETYAR